MSDQEAQDDARRAAEALLLRAEQRLSSPTGASASAGTNANTTSTTPTAAAAAQQAQASLKSALTKAQGSIKSAQTKVSASIETMERTAVEKMEAVAAAAAASKPKAANGNGSNATAEEGSEAATDASAGADTSATSASTSTSTNTDGAASMKAALGRAQGSIRSFQEKMSTSLDAVKTQTQEKVSASLSVVKHIDSSSSAAASEAKSTATTTTEAASAGAAADKIEKLKSESTAMVQEAGKSMKSAFRMAQGKMTASMQSLKLESVKQRAAGTAGNANATASETDQQDVDAKMFSDLVLEQIELCKSMMTSQNDDAESEEKEPPSEALLAVVGNLETSSARLASLIDAGAEGELDEETMERVLSVHDELRKTLDEFSKTMPPPTTKEETSATSDDLDGAAAAVADTSPTSGGGDSEAESEKPGMELGKTTAL